MSLWAYITTPQPNGLGLPDEEWDDITPREYYALSDVHQTSTRLWAIERAQFSNANFVTDGVPWTADDFLGYGDRDKRIGDKRSSELGAANMNRELSRVKKRQPGEPIPAGLPLWARDDFMPQPEKNPWDQGKPARVPRARPVPKRVGREGRKPEELV